MNKNTSKNFRHQNTNKNKHKKNLKRRIKIEKL